MLEEEDEWFVVESHCLLLSRREVVVIASFFTIIPQENLMDNQEVWLDIKTKPELEGEKVLKEEKKKNRKFLCFSSFKSSIQT